MCLGSRALVGARAYSVTEPFAIADGLSGEWGCWKIKVGACSGFGE